MTATKKVSCVTPTYKRFNCIERSIAGFLSQKTELATELIILNTDTDNPLTLDSTFTDEDKQKIKIINSNTDTVTGENYTNTGSIRRDAFAHATGEFYITWDDDDLYFPWKIQQCYDGLMANNVRAWKPYESFMWWREEPELAYNYLEATVLLYSSEVSFGLNTGPENLAWFDRLKNKGQLLEDKNSIPGYCFYWRDPAEQGGHKQSDAAYFNTADNFQRHREITRDHATRPLTKKTASDYQNIYSKFDSLFDKLTEAKPALMAKYVDRNFYRNP